MFALHGVRTEKDLETFRALLDVTLTSVDQFDAHTIEFEANVEKLVSTDPVSVYRAYLLYTKTLITPFPAFASHISRYVSDHPLPTDRDVHSLYTTLLVHIPTIDAHTRGQPFAGYASQPAPLPSPPPPAPAPAPATAQRQPRRRRGNAQQRQMADLKA